MDHGSGALVAYRLPRGGVHTGDVEAGYLGIGLVLVIGIAVVVYGWLSDRTDTKRRQAALIQPPDRDIPGLDPKSDTPSYVTEYEALHRPDRRVPLTDDERAELRQRLTSAPSLQHGHAAAEFVTDPGSGLCVLQAPIILVADAEVTTIRELLPFFERTRAGRPQVRGASALRQAQGTSGQAQGEYVVVSPAISKDVLTTLRVNATTRTLAGTVVLLPDADQRRVLCSLVGARPLQLDDLRSGYLPESALGTCDTWVSSAERLWILNEPVGLDRLDQPEGSAQG